MTRWGQESDCRAVRRSSRTGCRTAGQCALLTANAVFQYTFSR